MGARPKLATARAAGHAGQGQDIKHALKYPLLKRTDLHAAILSRSVHAPPRVDWPRALRVAPSGVAAPGGGGDCGGAVHADSLFSRTPLIKRSYY